MRSMQNDDDTWARQALTAVLVRALMAIATEWEARALLLARERM